MKSGLGESELFSFKQLSPKERSEKKHCQFVSTVPAILTASGVYQLISYLIS